MLLPDRQVPILPAPGVDRLDGPRQARLYSQILSSAIVALTDGPAKTGARKQQEVGEGLFTSHVAHDGPKGWHFVLFRIRRN